MATSAIFIQRGVPYDKQQLACVTYVDEQRLAMLALVPHWAPQDAVAMARDGEVTAIVTAFESRAATALAADVAPYGATVVVVHPEPHVLQPPQRPAEHSPVFGLRLVEVVQRWWRGGRSVQMIAEDIGTDTTDVRAILRQAGEYPDRSG